MEHRQRYSRSYSLGKGPRQQDGSTQTGVARQKERRSGAAALSCWYCCWLRSSELRAAAWLVLTPYGPDSETFVDIAPGSSAVRIGRQLEAAGLVRSRYAFDLVRWYRHGTLHAGTYRFDQEAPVTEVYARIARGDVFTIALTVPEGASIFEIAARVEQAKLGSRQDFLGATVSQTDLVADLDPGAKSLEGYLFPDTYRFSPKVTPIELVGAMVQALPCGGHAVGVG